MKTSMYQISIPTFIRVLNNLAAILEKGSAHAEARKIDPTVLLNARLFPDMFPFTRQIQLAADSAIGGTVLMNSRLLAGASLTHALNDRCWNRAVLGEALYPALDDCDNAVNLLPHSAAVLDGWGFVHLRRKEFDKAINDYDAALKIDPKAAWSLYCRGIAKSHMGKPDAAADMSAAVTLDSGLAERAKLYWVVAGLRQ